MLSERYKELFSVNPVEEVYLTEMEVSLLKTLMREPLTVFSPGQLFTATHPTQIPHDIEHIVRISIFRLRQKLGNGGGKLRIYSIPSKGYTLTSNEEAVGIFKARAGDFRDGQALPESLYRHEIPNGTLWFLSDRNVVIFPHGAFVELTHVEAVYFEKLICDPKRVFSHASLDQEAPVYKNRVAEDQNHHVIINMSRLRAKLGQNNNYPLIHTIPGQGYSLEEIAPEEIAPNISRLKRPPAGVLPETLAFIRDRIEDGSFGALEERTQKLIDTYYGLDVTYDKLVGQARVTTGERVRQIIAEGMRTLRQSLPPELQEQYSEEAILHGKHRSDPDYKAKITRGLREHHQTLTFGKISP